MDKSELQQLASRAKHELDAIEAADTPENEEKLTLLLATKGVQVHRRELKSPQRYEITLADGNTIEFVTLLDLERMCSKFGYL